MADEWTWPPLAMGDAPCSLGAKEVEALITLHTIPGVGLKQSLRFPLRHK
jgi:hypothetical protein